MLLAVLYSLLVAVGRPCRCLRRPPSLSSHFSSRHSRPLCGAGTTSVSLSVPNSNSGRWGSHGRGVAALRRVKPLPDIHLCPRLTWYLQTGTSPLHNPLSCHFLTSKEYPPLTWPMDSVPILHPPPSLDEEYVTYMPESHLRPLIRGIRLTFPSSPTLLAKGFPIDALRSAIKGLYVNGIETPLSPQHARRKASSPLHA
jgi:hypothetical protein